MPRLASTTLRLVFRTACVAVCCLLLSSAARAQDDPPPAYLAVVDGVASLERNGEVEPAVRDMPFLAGDRLRTENGRVEIQFPDGQTHDFVVSDSTGKEIWRWSEGRMFTQAMKSKTLKGKDDTVFEESWEATGHHGAFTAVAILKSENFPVETSVQFALP